jgi:hypothetical protein
MNGAYRHETSPEGRLAAVVKDLLIEFKEHRRDATGQRLEPDLIDIKDVIRPFLALWDTEIRTDEHYRMATERMQELAKKKLKQEKEIPAKWR